MTSNTEKLRAVFLTALMIGSVFAAGVAFTGSAAAAENPQVNTFTNTTVDEGTTVTHEVNFTVDNVSDDGNTDDFVVSLPALGEITAGPNNFSVVNESGGTVATTSGPSLSDARSGTNNAVTFSVSPDTASSAQNLTVSFDVDVSWDTVSSDTSSTANLTVTDSGNADISDVAIGTLTVENVAGTGDGTDDSSFNDGGIVFQGQTAAFDAADADNNYANNYTLYEGTASDGGSPVRELNTEGDFVNATTSGLTIGSTYFISNDGANSADRTFTVREQDFDVAFDGDEVPNDDTGIEVTWTSTNRQNNPYNVTVTADSLDDSELVDIFDDNYNVTDFDTESADGVEVEVPEGGSVAADANFSGISAGEYTFDFDVTDTTASDSGTLNVSDAASADSSFEDISRTARGDISTVNVSLTSSQTATVQIGSEDVGYLANVTVQDGNGDGYVAFDVNTYTMGNNTNVDATTPGTAYSAVAEDDSVQTVDIATENLTNPIAAGNYRTTVRTGGDASDTADDVSRLSITEASGVTAQNIWTAPGATPMDEVIGAVSQDSSVAEGDYVVHEVEAQGVFGVLQSTGQDSATDQLIAAVTAGDVAISVDQTEATTQLNRQPKELNYTDALLSGDASVVADAENSTFYVVADLDSVNLTNTNRSIVYDNDAFNASVTLTENTNLVDSNSTASAEFTADALETSLSMDEYNVTNAENQSISGTTTAADGTEFNVLVESLETEGDGFIQPDNPAVAENGELTAEVDFTEASVGDTFSVSLENPDGSEADSATGNVVEQVDDTTTTTADETTTTAADDTTTTADETTTTAADETTTTAADDTTTTGDDDGGEDGGSIPGFGVGIALVAILGAALLALRE